jgi:hypothetical protein
MESIVIPIMGMSIPIIIVPTVMAFKHARYLREVEHAERMKAMELGRTLPGDEPLSPASIATAIGAGVPLSSLVLAWLADLTSGGRSGEAVWVAAGAVALGGLICGTILAYRHFATRPQPATYQEAPKPEYDPDAYDVVGRRG